MGENAEEVEFDLPDPADDQDTVSGDVPMESAIDLEAEDKPSGQRIHDYKIDTLGRRCSVDIHGDRVAPNNGRPQRVLECL